MFTVLRDTSRTLANLLLARFQSDAVLGPLFGGGGAMQVSLNSPEQMAGANIQGLSVWLYRVVRDEERLNAPDVRLAPRLSRPPALPLRLHFLITPMTGESGPALETAQVILGKVLQVFNDRPNLQGTDLQNDLSGTDSVLNVRLEPMSLQEIYQVWDALEGSYRLSVSYEVSAVDLLPAVEPESFSPVLVVSPEYAEIVGTV